MNYKLMIGPLLVISAFTIGGTLYSRSKASNTAGIRAQIAAPEKSQVEPEPEVKVSERGGGAGAPAKEESSSRLPEGLAGEWKDASDRLILIKDNGTCEVRGQECRLSVAKDEKVSLVIGTDTIEGYAYFLDGTDGTPGMNVNTVTITSHMSQPGVRFTRTTAVPLVADGVDEGNSN